MGSNDSEETGKGYRVHFLRTLLTLGGLLLAAVLLGLVSEVFLRAVQTTADEGSQYLSLQAPFSVALSSLQAAVPIVGALVAVPLLAAHLLHGLHATESVQTAHSWLNQYLFGALGAEPKLRVREGKLKSGKERLAARVGGPASLTVYGDTAVVTERHGKLKRVLGEGNHRLEPYERIWELLDLRPQRSVREVFALTKEGIPVSFDVEVLFRVAVSLGNQRPRKQRMPTNPMGTSSYRYAEQAVLRAVTSPWVSTEEKKSATMGWADRVVGLVESQLRDILATYRLDWLVEAPQAAQEHPREEIRQRLEAGLGERLASVGAELLDVELGKMRVAVQGEDGSQDEELSEILSDIVSEQRIDAWNATWKARALRSRAEGEAKLLRIDMARIEAQAEMVIALAEALQPMMADEQTSEPYLLALRLVEALRWMAYDPSSRDFMPPEAMRTLKRIRALLDSETEPIGTGGEGEERGGTS